MKNGRVQGDNEIQDQNHRLDTQLGGPILSKKEGKRKEKRKKKELNLAKKDYIMEVLILVAETSMQPDYSLRGDTFI